MTYFGLLDLKLDLSGVEGFADHHPTQKHLLSESSGEGYLVHFLKFLSNAGGQAKSRIITLDSCFSAYVFVRGCGYCLIWLGERRREWVGCLEESSW